MFPRKLTKQVICRPDYPVVQTRHGKLRGMEIEGAFVFRGVQYGRAERFHMPEDPLPWKGIRDALAFGPVCPELATSMMEWDGYAVPNYWYPQREDCQYLNIWTQHIDPNAKRPVMVWLHGGAYHKCSGINCFSYDGTELSKFGDVVVINVCHRLHALGFLDLSDYGEEYRNSGNCGIADLVKALEWIRDNITAFGGDPDRVMLFGQSGGGGKIAALLQTPAADGLFHAGAMESGGCDTPNNAGHPHAYASLMTEKILRHLNIVKENIKELETVPFYKLARAVVDSTAEWRAETGGSYKWQPLINDYFLGHPMNVGFRPENIDLPLLIGSTFGEFANNLHLDPAGRSGDGHKNCWDAETCKRRYAEKYGELADPIYKAFRAAFPDKPPADGLFFDPVWRSDTVRFCRERARQGSKTTYNWMMNLELPPDGGCVSFHQAEQPYVFHESEYFESSFIPGISDRLQDQFAGAWVALAECGRPDIDLLPAWRPVQADGPFETLIFDRECKIVYDYDFELLKVMSSLTDFGSFGPNQAAYGGGPRGAR